MRRIIHLYAIVMMLVMTSIPAFPQPMERLDFSPLDSLVSFWMEKDYYPGGAICVGREGEVLFQKCYGDFQTDTQVYVASAGKWAAAAVIAAVVDRTSLDWDDPVEKWIPSYKGSDKARIPLRRLLSHTSGIRPYLPMPRVDEYNHLEESVAEILPLETVFPVGTRFEYGGLAMQVAGRMAEMAMGGEEFESLFQRLIAKPLGMKNSHFTPVNTDGGHSPMLGGGLCTTLDDYSHFLEMILGDGEYMGRRILSPESIREMQKDQVGDAEVRPGEFVERGVGQNHHGIYGLGEWRELVDDRGEAYQISSPGWAGAYPWINKRERIFGFFIAHVQGPANRPGFSSFYGSPILSKTTSRILKSVRHQRPSFPAAPPSMTEDLTSRSGRLPKGFHPTLVTSSPKQVMLKIRLREWARMSYDSLRSSVEPYVFRHKTDPEWIVSRLAMYWGEGEHYTQCYLKNENWDYGEGNAPVPTVRMPGMRTWNEYINVPLEDRIPYNVSGDMLGIDRRFPGSSPVLVPYKKSGHMVRSNNVEILTLAEKAAFVYWLTGDKAFGKFASDIYQTWAVGVYYMKPILDPERSSGGYGGWNPGGIVGYYDYEQIHDDTAMHGAAIYAFAYDYLVKHPSKSLKKTGKNIKDLSEIVMKRFVNLGMVRGQRNGNWNINGWNCILLPILVLDDNDTFADGQGKQYYLHYLTEESTNWRASIPESLQSYDRVTGLWPESPGYAFSTIDMLLDWAGPLRSAGIDIIGGNALMEKASMAVFPWLDDRSHMVVFGDSRGGNANYETFERLLGYYEETGNKDQAGRVVDAIRSGVEEGVYSRIHPDWKSICFYAGELPVSTTEKDVCRSSYSRVHEFITLRNPGVEFPMMAALYGGHRGGHLSQNGLAVQFYGFGYALAPDASAYVSYWSPDYIYHQSVTGANTIVPGYKQGRIEIVAMDPEVPDDSFTGGDGVHPDVCFADVRAGEKERTVSAVRTSAGSGYYVDLFSPGLAPCDYWMHNVGSSLSVRRVDGSPLLMEPRDTLIPSWTPGYAFLSSIRAGKTSDRIIAEWTMPEDIRVNLWINDATNREIIIADAPSTTLNSFLTPGGVSATPQPTPTLLVRQEDEYPYLAVYEASKKRPTVRNVSFSADENGEYRVDVVSDGQVTDHIIQGKDCRFGLVRERNGRVELLYMGQGTNLNYGDYHLQADENVYVALRLEDGRWHCSATGPVRLYCSGSSAVFY